MKFASAALKLSRADKHIADFETVFNAFVAANPHTFVTKTDPKTGQTIFKIKFQNPPPREISLIAGDAIHNLRTALDHLMWELMGFDGGTQDRHTKFPTGNSVSSYVASCNGILTPRADTKRFMSGLEVCGGGKRERLYGLHCLDNQDKHTVITPIVTIGSVNKLRVVHPNGTTMADLTDCSASVGPDGYVNFMSLAPGLEVELDHDTKATPDIYFHDAGIFEAKAILPTLRQLFDDACEVREAFKAFTDNRK